MRVLREFVAAAEKSPFTLSTKMIPLQQIESVWREPNNRERFVFQP